MGRLFQRLFQSLLQGSGGFMDSWASSISLSSFPPPEKKNKLELEVQRHHKAKHPLFTPVLLLAMFRVRNPLLFGKLTWRVATAVVKMIKSHKYPWTPLQLSFTQACQLTDWDGEELFCEEHVLCKSFAEVGTSPIIFNADSLWRSVNTPQDTCK